MDYIVPWGRCCLPHQWCPWEPPEPSRRSRWSEQRKLSLFLSYLAFRTVYRNFYFIHTYLVLWSFLLHMGDKAWISLSFSKCSGSEFFHPGAKRFRIPDPDLHQRILVITLKNFIQDQDLDFFSFPEPGSRGQKGTRSRIRIRNTACSCRIRVSTQSSWIRIRPMRCNNFYIFKLRFKQKYNWSIRTGTDQCK